MEHLSSLKSLNIQVLYGRLLQRPEPTRRIAHRCSGKQRLTNMVIPVFRTKFLELLIYILTSCPLLPLLLKAGW